jgi:hypothetical protein
VEHDYAKVEEVEQNQEPRAAGTEGDAIEANNANAEEAKVEDEFLYQVSI